jgi:putative hemolysin
MEDSIHKELESRLFQLRERFRGPLGSYSFNLLRRYAGWLLCLQKIDEIYRRSTRQNGDIVENCLANAGVRCVLESGEGFIPRKGSFISVANHPTGIIDGLAMLSALRRVRPDVKLVANSISEFFSAFRSHLIYIYPFDGSAAFDQNLIALNQTLAWLKGGGGVAVFPAGDISSFDYRKGRVLDPQWTTTFIRISLLTRSPILPVFMEDHHNFLFHFLGSFHWALRLLLIPRKILSKKNRSIRISIGKTITYDELKSLGNTSDQTGYVRRALYELKNQNKS